MEVIAALQNNTIDHYIPNTNPNPALNPAHKPNYDPKLAGIVFDLVYIDADKANNTNYLLELFGYDVHSCQ